MHLKQELVLAESQIKECSDETLKRMNNSLIACIGYRSTVSVSDQPSKAICMDVATEIETQDVLEESLSVVSYTLSYWTAQDVICFMKISGYRY